MYVCVLTDGNVTLRSFMCLCKFRGTYCLHCVGLCPSADTYIYNIYGEVSDLVPDIPR